MLNQPSNRFQKIDKLGEGTYGVVFKVKDLKTQEVFSFVLKVDCGTEENPT
jgi:hypothetical protein